MEREDKCIPWKQASNYSISFETIQMIQMAMYLICLNCIKNITGTKTLSDIS